MTADEFKTWRENLGLTQSQAAAALGITRRGLQKRETGLSQIIRETEFACQYLAEHPEKISLE